MKDAFLKKSLKRNYNLQTPEKDEISKDRIFLTTFRKLKKLKK